jgi:hypothetical protein
MYVYTIHTRPLSVQVNCSWVWVLYYDRRSVGQSVFEQSTHLGLTNTFLLLSDSCGFVDMGRSLWRDYRSVVYNCFWSSPAQSSSGPSPVGLVTIFYCLRFKTSLFIASYDSQGYGGGIRPRLHTGWTVLSSTALLTTPMHGPSRKDHFIQYLYCCMRIRCRGNVFTEPLPPLSLAAMKCSDVTFSKIILPIIS